MRNLKAFMLLAGLLLVGCNEKPDAMDSEGHAIRLQDYRGQWVLVNYWAEWCHACLMEMPDLVKLQAKYPDKITLIGVNFDSKSNDYLQHFNRAHHINYLMTSQLNPKLLGLTKPMATVPTTVLLAPDGHVDQVILQPKKLSQWESLMHLKSD